MATYLPGVTDYVPQIQPWKPNYNFYQNVLERKQSQYDRGWEQTNNVYSSILNAPMMREQNIERRDNFFKSVENQIQQLSGVDLSLQQNVDTATQIFKPFYEDDNIVHDMSFTKKYQTEMKHAEFLRNCTDKDKCGNKYWDGGVRLMNHIAQDFVTASDDQALRIGAPRYVNYANFMDKASAAVKEAGFKMEYEAKEGRYMVKRVNGPQAVQPLMDFMMARFGDDPELTSFYGAKAALLRYENPEAALNTYETVMLRSKAETQEEYNKLIEDKANQTNFSKAKNVINKTKENVKAGADRLFLQKRGLEKIIENEGIIEGSPEDKAYRTILEREDSVVNAVETVDTITNQANNMEYVDSDGNVISKGAIDGVVANAMLMRDMSLSAQTIAYKDYSVTKKADPYALADYKNQLSLKTAAIKHNYALETANVKSILKEGENYRKFLIDRGYINPFTGSPKYIDPKTQTMPILPGGGMATGDPADIAAALKQKIAAGVSLKPSDFDNSYLYANTGFTYKPSKSNPNKPRIIEAMNAPDVFLENNLQTAIKNFPEVLKPGKPQASYTGLKSGEGVLKLDYNNVKSDTRIQEIISKGENGDLDGALVNYKFSEFMQPAKNIVSTWEQQAANNQGFIVGSQLNNLINVASSENDPYNAFALDGMIGVGNMIKENLNNPAIKEALVKSGSYDILKDFPNSTNSKNLDAKFFKKLSDEGLAEDIMLAAGKRDLFKKFTNKQGQHFIKQYDSEDLVDISNLDLISKEEANELRHRNNTIPLKPLNEAEMEALKKYDYYTTQPKLDNDFRSIGLNTPIPALRDFNNKQLTQMALTENMYKASQNSKRNYNNQMKAAAQTMAKSFENESGDFASKMLAENMVRVGKDGWAELMPLGHIYSKAAEKAPLPGGDSLWQLGKDTGLINPFDGLFTSTVLDLEKEYMGGAKGFTNEAIKNMLWSSELPIDKTPPRNLNREALWNNVDLSKLQGEVGGILNEFGVNKQSLMQSDFATFTALLKDPSTQVIRNKDNTIAIKSPYISGNITQSYNLDEIEMHKGFEKMFDRIEDKSGKMRAEFLNMAQNTKGKKMSETLMFPQVSGQSAGNFNYAVPSMKDITVQAGNHTQELALVTETLNEISLKYNQDLSKYGLEQGDKNTLDLILSELTDDVKKYSEDNLMLNIDVEPVMGNMELSKVTVNLHPKTKHKYLKQKGQLVYDSKTDELDQKWVSLVDESASYYIPNAQAQLIKNTQPDPYYALAGLSDGEGYVDDMFWDEFGGKVEYKRVGDRVQIIPTYRIKDPETGKFRELRMTGPDGPLEQPLTGVDWKQIFEMQYQNIYNLPYKNLDADLNLKKIDNVEYYKK